MTDVLGRLTAALADRYAIERELGAGGMATVYLAHDVRHDRQVALKVLRPELASILGAERFLSEIKTTANLQHPHILSLFDSGDADGLVFYVMPFVEGESLRDRLARERQLPIEEAVAIAREVADALEYAHRHGVIHRDIKPENILLHGGHALVADFGIALAASRSDGGTRMTETGMSLGTPHYMAPEQAMGEREISAKADIYALGCVLYEMLTGEPPFTGPTAQAIIARVMTEAPRPIALQRHTVPAHVEAAVVKALEKLPADRFATAEAFAEALANPVFGATSAVTAAAPTGSRRSGGRARLRDPFVLVPTLGLLAAAAVAIGLAVRKAPTAVPPISYVLAAPDSARPLDNYPWPAAISPDGGTIVYTVSAGAASGVLVALRSDELQAIAIPGTANAYQPYFSPDGRWLAFEQAGKERKARLDGSQPVTITSAGGANGAVWTALDQIVLGAQGPFHGLSIVSAAGGDAAALTHPDTARGERDHLWPVATPDGRAVVFTIWTGSNASSRLAVATIPGGRVVPLGIAGIRPLAILDGVLVYVQADGEVMAVRLAGGLRKVVGQPFPVHDPVPVNQGLNGNSGAYVSRGGAMVTSRGGELGLLEWFGPGGRAVPAVPGVRTYAYPRIAPDGKRIAVVVLEDGKSDVWIYDPALSTFSKLTDVGSVTSVEWSADGSRVIYAATGQGQSGDVWSQPVAGGSAAERLFGEPYVTPVAALSPDGRSLLVVSVTTSVDLVRVPLDSTRTARPYAATPANEGFGHFSPDGRWVAMESDETGRGEVYVRSFPDPSARIQVSVAGGEEPVWSADGTRIYYRAGNALIAARVALAPAFRLIGRDTVMRGFSPIAGTFSSDYDVSRDGKRILAIAPQSNDFQLVVSPNWITEFRRRVAESRQ
jgi:eukaryotic-like serine/threonine-protein kinase